jgi:hypothetical protein
MPSEVRRRFWQHRSSSRSKHIPNSSLNAFRPLSVTVEFVQIFVQNMAADLHQKFTL